MDEWKSILASKTFWGAVMMLAAVIAGLFGIEIGATDQSDLVGALVGIGGGVGMILTVVGRVKATKRVSLTGKAKEIHQ